MGVAEYPLFLSCHVSGLASMEMPFSPHVLGCWFKQAVSSRTVIFFPVCNGTFRSGRLSAAWLPSLCDISDLCTILHADCGGGSGNFESFFKVYLSRLHILALHRMLQSDCAWGQKEV